MRWHSEMTRLLASWWRSRRFFVLCGRARVLTAASCLLVLTACGGAPEIVLERFPVEATLTIVAEGEKRIVRRTLECTKEMEMSKYCYTCLVWATRSRRMIEPLPSGGSLIFYIGHNFCNALAAGQPTPAFDRSSPSLIAWVDNLERPMVIERYRLGSHSISDEMASAAKIKVAGYDLTLRRLDDPSVPIDDENIDFILWFGKAGFRRREDEVQYFYLSTEAHVIREPEWRLDPEIAARVKALNKPALIRGGLAQRIRELSLNWTLGRSTRLPNSTFLKIKPTFVPFRRNSDRVWELDTAATGVYVSEYVGSQQELRASYSDRIRLGDRDYPGETQLVVYDPAIETIYVISQGLLEIF